MIQMGSAQTEGLEINTKAQHGCVIVSFLASDEFHRISGALIRNKEAIEALKLLVETVAATGDVAWKALLAVGGPIAGWHTLRLGREKATQQKIKTKILAQQLEQNRLRTELLQRSLDRPGHVEDEGGPSLNLAALLSDPLFIEQTLPAVGEILLPLVTGEARSVGLRGGFAGTETLVNADRLRSLIEEASSAEPTHHALGRVDTLLGPKWIYAENPLQQQRGKVRFTAIRLDRKKSGWRVLLNGVERAAWIRDMRFLNDVASGSEVVVPQRLYEAIYREASGGRRIDIDKIMNHKIGKRGGA
ncbi:MAG: hypothetical protein JO036_17795 [Candidatus Eremiobacteraeota bacterium]|nr:hypothetical protein [Candidatus Eremiobacteraeota bacterium]